MLYEAHLCSFALYAAMKTVSGALRVVDWTCTINCFLEKTKHVSMDYKTRERERPSYPHEQHASYKTNDSNTEAARAATLRYDYE